MRAGSAAVLSAACAIGLLVALLLGHGHLRSVTIAHGAETDGFAHASGTTADAQSGAAHGLSALPVAARLAVSRELGGDLHRFALTRVGHGYAAGNAPNDFSARFGAGGATVTMAHGARLGLALRGVGFDRALEPVAGEAAPQARANRVEYRRGPVSEWFANGPGGLEQGFTIPRAPGRSGHTLTLALGLSGSLHVRPGRHGEMMFDTGAGRPELSYGGLSVVDVSGRALPAHLELEHGRLLIRIDAAGARYPLTVDPLLNQVGELYSSAGVKEDELGEAVAASGETVVVGDPETNNVSSARDGVAYVFTEGPGGWATATQTAKLLPKAQQTKEEHFGAAVAISGNTIVVGAPGRESGSGVDAGSAYVFVEPSHGWGAEPVQNQTLELLNSEDVAEYEFGDSVAISGETIVVGAPFYRDYVQNQSTPARDGAAFVFQQPAGGWASASKPMYQTATLVEHEANVEELGELGQSVAVGESGGVQTIVVGAPHEPVGSEAQYKRGIVFLYERPAEGWLALKDKHVYAKAKLVAAHTTEFAELGASVAIAEGVIVAGAAHAEVEGVKHGAAYVFTEPTAGWTASSEQTQAAELTSPGESEFDEIGKSTSVEGSTVAVTGRSQPIFLFAMPAAGWSGEQRPTAEFYPASEKANATGLYAVSLSGGEIFAGNIAATPPEEKGSAKYAGAVDVVPFAPLVTTGASSGVTETTATVAGTVDPDQTEVKSCRIEYGTTAAYGAEAACTPSPTTGIAPVGVTAALSELAGGTTYHYRVVAANVVDTSYGLDETFTTSSSVSPPPTKSKETSTGVTSTTSSGSQTTTGSTQTTVSGAALQAARALACSNAQIALINVVTQGSHVLLTGAARQVLAGKKVAIKLLSTGKVVATPTVSPAGTFTASAPLPPAKGRGSNRTRYQASIGSLKSLALKLERRAYMLHATLAGSHVSIAGRVTGSFRPGTAVHITLRVTCTKYKNVATVKLTRGGTFSATVPAPSGANSQIAVYRATTTVLEDGHPFATFTLPTPPS